MIGTLTFKDGSRFDGQSFGAPVPAAGEVVFTTGMTGYPETLTDPSYRGQILVFTYPLLGNYGVGERIYWESSRVQAAGVVVSHYIDTPSHHASRETLAAWLARHGVPLVEIKDTRALVQKIREEGTPLGKLTVGRKDIPFEDPNVRNLVAEVSIRKPVTRLPGQGGGKRHVVLIDCGAKRNIERELLARGLKVTTVPWNWRLFNDQRSHDRKTVDVIPGRIDAVVLSNGPGDPKMVQETIATVREALRREVPILGICLGNQILALAAGGDTYKLKFGHRGHNQPCTLVGSERSLLTTQNHGYSVSKVPPGFRAWFTNGNDGTNEGLIHRTKPFMAVQFHPEHTPGPTDAGWVFDYFLSRI